VRIGAPAVRQNNINLARAMHNVAIGQHEPVRRDDKTRAAALALAILTVHFDIYDRRADFLGCMHHRFGIGIQQHVVRRRRDRRRRNC
jgi:hypothetical protein